jgi:hypothetical protein
MLANAIAPSNKQSNHPQQKHGVNLCRFHVFTKYLYHFGFWIANKLLHLGLANPSAQFFFQIGINPKNRSILCGHNKPSDRLILE